MLRKKIYIYFDITMIDVFNISDGEASGMISSFSLKGCFVMSTCVLCTVNCEIQSSCLVPWACMRMNVVASNSSMLFCQSVAPTV